MTEVAGRQSERLWIWVAAIALGVSVPAVFFGKAVIGTLAALPGFLAVLHVLRERAFGLTFRDLSSSPFLICVIVVAVLWLASSLGSIDPQKSLTTWGRTVGICTLCYFISQLVANKPAILPLALKTLLATSLIILGWAVFSLYIDPAPFKLFALIKGGQPILIQTLKPYTSVTATLAPIIAWAGWRYGGAWRTVAAINLLLIALTIYAKGIQPGTSAMFGFIGGLLLLLIVIALRRLKRKTAWLLFGLLFAFSLFVAGYVIGHLPAPPFDENNQPQLPVPDWHRQVIWGFILEVIKDTPWLGIGPNTVNQLPGANTVIPYFNQEYVPSHPHNWMLEVAAETGLLGLAGLLASLLLAIHRLGIETRTDAPAAWAAIALVGVFWVSSLGNFSIWSAWWLVVLAILLSLPLAALRMAAGGARPGG